MKQQKEKQSDVVFRIKQGALLKEQLHPMRVVGSLVHRRAFSLLSTHQQHLIAHLLKGKARLVDPLVGNQVVDDRYNDTFHGGKGRKNSECGMRNAE